MRILQMTEASSAGVGQHLMDLCEGLLAADCEVHVLYSPHRVDQRFSTRLQMPGLHSQGVSMRRGPHPSDWTARNQLLNYLKDHGPFDVIHAHSTKAGLIARTVPGGGAKVVYTPHCIYTMNPNATWTMRRVVKLLEQKLARRTDAIIAVSPDEQQHLLDLGMEASRVRCIVNGLAPVDWPDRTESRRLFELPEDAVVAGFLGRLCDQKNPLNFVEAVAVAAAQQPNLLGAVVGSGPLLDDAQALADKLGVADHFRWLGYQRPEVAMAAFDLFVLSSNYEGMPYVLLEAISAGLPVIATEVGGARLAIDDGESGFVVPVRHPLQLAERIVDLTADPELRAEFSLAATAKSRDFTAAQMVERTLQVYGRPAPTTTSSAEVETEVVGNS